MTAKREESAQRRREYMSRKEYGSISVFCPGCKRRGVTNRKIVGRKTRVLCADCRRAGKTEE